MTKELSYFFPEQVEKRDAGFVLPASKRIKDSEGNPINWEFEFVNEEKFKEIKNSAQKKEVKNGKIKFVYDADTMLENAILETVKYPDLKNADLQDAYGVTDNKELLSKMLYPDEKEKLGRDVAIKLGLLDDPNEMLEEAKN